MGERQDENATDCKSRCAGTRRSRSEQPGLNIEACQCLDHMVVTPGHQGRRDDCVGAEFGRNPSPLSFDFTVGEEGERLFWAIAKFVTVVGSTILHSEFDSSCRGHPFHRTIVTKASVTGVALAGVSRSRSCRVECRGKEVYHCPIQEIRPRSSWH